jgi:hypothetical protein
LEADCLDSEGLTTASILALPKNLPVIGMALNGTPLRLQFPLVLPLLIPLQFPCSGHGEFAPEQLAESMAYR